MMSKKEDLINAAIEYGMAAESARSALVCHAPFKILETTAKKVEYTLEALKEAAAAYFNDVYDGPE